MRTIWIIFFFAIGTQLCTSQDMIVSVLLESLVTGSQSGVSMMYESKAAFGMGGFYQRDLRPSRELGTLSTFYGAQIQVPLVKSERLLFSAVVRGGLVNEFIVLVPGLETRINIRRRFALALSSSMRMNYPALSGKVIVKIF
jgi:hypothetical protein